MTILFQDLLESLGTAIKKVQTAMDSFQLDSYKDVVKYKDTEVDEQGNEQQVRKLKTISMPIPDYSGKTTVREIPLAALLRNDTLHLDEVRIKMAFHTSWDEEKKSMSLDLDMQKSDETTGVPPQELELVFKRGEAPEGIARVNNELAKTI